jgi:hypothetical protein
MLPTVAQQKYAEAKTAFDRKQFLVSADAFGKLLELFADPDLTSVANRPPLSDLRTLSLGFRELSLQAIAPPPAAQAPPPATPLAAAPSPPAAPPAPKIFTTADAEIAPPIPILQQLPGYRGTLTRTLQGVMEVVIDENGAVVQATMRSSVNPTYDRLALNAAVLWRYKPATLNGRPVRYRKLIVINLTPQQ